METMCFDVFIAADREMSMQSCAKCMLQFAGKRWQVQSISLEQLKQKMLSEADDAIRQLGEDVRHRARVTVVDYLMANIHFREVVDVLVGNECRDAGLPLVGNKDISLPQSQSLDVLKHLFMAAWFAVTCIVRVVQDPEDEMGLDVSMEHGSREPYLI